MPVSVRLDEETEALLNKSDHYHLACLEILKTVNEPMLTTWPVLTEAFYILGFSWKAQDNLSGPYGFQDI